MKKQLIIVLISFFFILNLCAEPLQDRIIGILDYIKRNNLTVYKDGTILSNEKAINFYLNDLITRMGKKNTIEFLVRTKKNGLYKTVFMIKDAENSIADKLLGNIMPVSEANQGAVSYYPVQSLDVITLLFRYKEKETLDLKDYIYLLNSMLYKDETLNSMIDNKIKTGENKSADDTNRIQAMTKDLLLNKIDIIDVSTIIITSYQKEIDALKTKTNRTQEDEDILKENAGYIGVYQQLKETMQRQLDANK